MTLTTKQRQESLQSDGQRSVSRSQPGEGALWLQAFIRDVDERTSESSTKLLPSVNQLKQLIESRPQLRMWAAAMFEEVPNKVPYNAINQASPPRSHVRGYEHMIELLNVIVSEAAPTWTLSTAGNIKLMGVPVQAILDRAMGTPSGHAFFLDAQVNACFKKILEVWRDELLATSKSQSVITTSPGNWLSPEAVAAIEKDANQDRGQWYTFEQLFACDPRGDPVHWGFQSFDDFFVRRFRNFDKLRPIGYPDRPEWVVNACESKPVAIKSHVNEVDSFWLKAKNYSISEMLNHHRWVEQFVGGTVHQSVLLTTSYHRWTAPVSGSVVHAEVIAGAHFSERSTNGIGSEPVSAPLHNLVYLSHVATRAVVFIQADGPVGLMCFIGIGIADVSSCEILPKFMTDWPKKIKKGEELGMFHYGGSTQCLLFRRGLKLAFTEGALPGNQFRTLAVRSPLALAYE